MGSCTKTHSHEDTNMAPAKLLRSMSLGLHPPPYRSPSENGVHKRPVIDRLSRTWVAQLLVLVNLSDEQLVAVKHALHRVPTKVKGRWQAGEHKGRPNPYTCSVQVMHHDASLGCRMCKWVHG